MRRARVTGEAAVPEAVNRLLNRFEYPDLDTQPIPFSGGLGGGAPTIVIAASNSLDIEKDKADVVCTGVNDQDVIQQALNSLLFGGRLLFCAGTFNIAFNGSAHCIDTQGFSGIRFEGMGTGATIFNVTDSYGGSETDRYAFNSEGDANNMFEHFAIDGGSGTLGATNGLLLGDHSTARDIIYSVDGIGVRIPSGETIVEANQFLNDGLGVQAWGNGCVVSRCHFANGGAGIDVAGIDTAFITNNEMFTQTQAITVGSTSTAGGLIIAGNTITAHDDTAIELTDYEAALITGNTIRTAGEHGIALFDAHDSHVIGNVVMRASQDGANTWDGIHIAADRCVIMENRVFPDAGGFPATRYGINVASGICNIVVGNVLGPTGDYGTDALNDAGADTQLFWPADATYGDNFIGCYGS